MSEQENQVTGFEKQKEAGIIREFMSFLWENKLWWMMPIMLVLGLLVALMAFAAQSGAAAPFIYTLF